jgi:ABC-type sugar transport system substrate-binding protein
MRASFKALAAVAAAGALLLAGCSAGGSASTGSGGDGDKPFRVVAFTSGNQTPVGAWFVKNIKAEGKKRGWDVNVIQGDNNFTKMNPAVESAIAQGADAVLDGYTASDTVQSITQAAKDADIPVFAIDSATAPDKAFVLNVTTDQQQIVDQTLGALKDKLGGSLEGKRVMVIGHDPQAGIRKRQQLAYDDLKKAGAVIADGQIKKVLDPATGRQEALAFVQDYLSAHPNGLDAVWTGWDDAALGAAQAVTEAHSTAIVSGVDAISEGVSAIEKGDSPMAVSTSQGWPDIMNTVLDAMATYQKSGDLPKDNYQAVKVTLVTKDNAADITPSDALN